MTTDALRDDIAVAVRGLRKSYGSMEALRGIDFEIHRGETFALLGPNGAGKSTTIEILEGYRDRSGGEAHVLGVDPGRGGRDWRARVGIVLQSDGEPGDATVTEQLRHFAGLYPNPRSVEDVIAAVGLEAKAKTRIAKLSGGQRRRVDVALGIIGRPEVLFLDEPTTGFDPAARRQFWDVIRSLQDEGTTILLTTHYLDEAAQLSHRGAVIAGGEIVAMGRIDELGGAEARTPIVRWLDRGTPRHMRTPEPGKFVAELARGGEPERIEIVRPTLEDIYLGLVGEHPTASASDAKLATTGSVPAVTTRQGGTLS